MFPHVGLWELIHRSCLSEMSLGTGGKGVMHRSTGNPTARWGQDCIAGFPCGLWYIIKVGEMGKTQHRLKQAHW